MRRGLTGGGTVTRCGGGAPAELQPGVAWLLELIVVIVLEARIPDREFIDLYRMLAPVAELIGGGNLGGALDRVLRGLRGAVGRGLGDDLSVLVAEYRGN